MLILIAESKTMLDDQQPVASSTFESHTPPLEEPADSIMGRLADLSQHELIAQTGLTPSLAARLRQQIYEFPNKTMGMKAIEAFTGVVFKALRYDSLSATQQAICQKDVRIISSLYGLLRPDDIIKPYRLDFTAKVAPGGATLCSFWKKDVTVRLVRSLIDGGHGELLSLLPADAAKCLDWKVIKRFCKVWKADFVEIADDGSSRTPAATKLKTMRGTLLRHILCREITRVADLTGLKTDDIICEGTPRYPDHLLFVC